MKFEQLTLWVTILTPIAVAWLGWLQWRISETTKAKREALEDRATARKRDAEMLAWGDRVIRAMSVAEVLIEFPLPQDGQLEMRKLMSDASALIDQGRLFFPNVLTDGASEAGDRTSDNPRGFRDLILDEVVRLYLIARFGMEHGTCPMTFKFKLRAARRRFVNQLQKSMGESLTKAGFERTGVSISKDPEFWPLDENKYAT